jgi:Flp pilus assembly protein TadG
VAAVEFALVAPVLLTVLMGFIEFGRIYTSQITLTNAARDGARFAITHASGWSSQDPAPAGTIEAAIQTSVGAGALANDDAHIVIEYFDNTKSPAVQCGHYSVAAAVFVADNGYQTQGNCVVAGNLVEIKLAMPYSFLTAASVFFPSGFTLKASTTMVIEQ